MKIHFYDPYKRIVQDIEDDELDEKLREYLDDTQMQHLYQYAEREKTYVIEVGVQWAHMYVYFANKGIFELNINRY